MLAFSKSPEPMADAPWNPDITCNNNEESITALPIFELSKYQDMQQQIEENNRIKVDPTPFCPYEGRAGGIYEMRKNDYKVGKLLAGTSINFYSTKALYPYFDKYQISNEPNAPHFFFINNLIHFCAYKLHELVEQHNSYFTRGYLQEGHGDDQTEIYISELKDLSEMLYPIQVAHVDAKMQQARALIETAEAECSIKYKNLDGRECRIHVVISGPDARTEMGMDKASSDGVVDFIIQTDIKTVMSDDISMFLFNLAHEFAHAVYNYGSAIKSNLFKESEADYQAIFLLTRAGYEPEKFYDVWLKPKERIQKYDAEETYSGSYPSRTARSLLVQHAVKTVKEQTSSGIKPKNVNAALIPKCKT